MKKQIKFQEFLRIKNQRIKDPVVDNQAVIDKNEFIYKIKRDIKNAFINRIY